MTPPLTLPGTLPGVRVVERPILFSGPLVRAILDGRKTQTRRLVKPTGKRWPNATLSNATIGATGDYLCVPDGSGVVIIPTPFKVGDRLYVRETWALHSEPMEGRGIGYTLEYLCDRSTRPVAFDGRVFPSGPPRDAPQPWPATAVDRGGRPSIHMPRWAARLFLTVESVRVERLQSITEEDARAEGVDGIAVDGMAATCAAREHFAEVWSTIAPAGSRWDDDPWVWVVGFKREVAL